MARRLTPPPRFDPTWSKIFAYGISPDETISPAPEGRSFDRNYPEWKLETPMPHVTVFIPGLMGSRLRQSNGTDLWTEDIYTSLSRLASNPALMQWNPHSQVVPAGVLEEVHLMGKRYGLCGLLRREMHNMHSSASLVYGEFSYDWRQDIRVSAKQLGDWLSQRYGFSNDGQGRQEKENEKRLAIIGHSMGGLVAAVAMRKGYIHAQNVRKFLCVGSPLCGAPSAFRALYDLGYLRGMDWIESWVNKRKNKRASRNLLLNTIQSFLSIYQLLPFGQTAFVQVNGNLINPLSDTIIPQNARNAATSIHTHLASLEQFLQHNGVEYRFIYSFAWKKSLLARIPVISGLIGVGMVQDTDYLLAAAVGATAGGQATYTIKNVINLQSGDGTVPLQSATLSLPQDNTRRGVAGVKHAFMCDNHDVVDLVTDFL